MRPAQAIIADIDTANQPTEYGTAEWNARQSALASLAVKLAGACRPRPFGDDGLSTGFLDVLQCGMPIRYAEKSNESDINVRSVTVPEVGPAVIELDNGDRYELTIRKVETT